MKKRRKRPIKCNPKCCDKEKCCESIEWGIGYLIGETVKLLSIICIHFVNNANKGYERSNDRKK